MTHVAPVIPLQQVKERLDQVNASIGLDFRVRNSLISMYLWQREQGTSTQSTTTTPLFITFNGLPDQPEYSAETPIMSLCVMLYCYRT